MASPPTRPMSLRQATARTLKAALWGMPIAAAVLAVVAALAILFGGPSPPAALPSLNDPFRGIDSSAVPAPRNFSGRDETRLGYRGYPAGTSDTLGSVVLVHGASASSHSMHWLAQSFAAAGFDAYALDMRGHGASGPKGHIRYIGQLEDDVEAFMRAVQPRTPVTLVGFSAGGGFALRMASSDRQTLFNHYLLLSPFVHQDGPTFRANAGGMVNIGLPRIVALTTINRFGITAFNHLPVSAFALNDAARDLLTPSYSYNLATNFRPRHDWHRDIGAVRQPLAVLVGADDEAFHADRFAEVFALARQPVPVTLIPSTGHAAMVLQPPAISAAVAAVVRLGSEVGASAPQ